MFRFRFFPHLRGFLLLSWSILPLCFSGPPARYAVPENTSRNFETTNIFDFSPRARAVYQQILSLRFTEARASLAELQGHEPGNLIVPFLENYLDVLQILIDDDRTAYKRLEKRRTARLARMARGDNRSPYYRYTQAEIRLQWAILQIRYGDYLAGGSNIKQAYALLKENRRRFPEFIANLKSLGILHALVGNIPTEYRWAIKALSGMSGTVKQGLGELKTALTGALQHDFIFEPEARVACAFLMLHLDNDKTGAWQTLAGGLLAPRDNPLAAFALANMAIRTGRNDDAIRLLEECPRGASFHPFPYLDYLLGIAKLNRLDADANVPLETFVREFRGATGIKEAYQKLAWHALVRDNPKGYQACMHLVKTAGNTRSDPDKAALREARSGEMPDPRLTRARLLFDGGYYARARDVLRGAEAGYRGNGKSNLEYTYRQGRIHHELGDTGEAIRFYERTIEAGARQPWYFACNAALQLGLLYEKLGNNRLARTAFERCLTIEPEEYAASLHTRAKAGLVRVR